MVQIINLKSQRFSLFKRDMRRGQLNIGTSLSNALAKAIELLPNILDARNLPRKSQNLERCVSFSHSRLHNGVEDMKHDDAMVLLELRGRSRSSTKSNSHVVSRTGDSNPTFVVN